MKKPKGDGNVTWIDEKWFEGKASHSGAERHSWIRGRLLDLGRQATDIAIVWGRLEGKKKLDDAVISRFIKTGTPTITLERAVVLAELLQMGLLELTVRLSEKPLPTAVLGPLPDVRK